MSILIKGMEMPTNCIDCPMCYDMMECTVAEPIINFFKEEELKKFDFCTERHPRCPLVNVPPHGRLIDADALEKDIDKYIGGEESRSRFHHWVQVQSVVIRGEQGIDLP